ncbi:MAG: MFS transporter, partial [Thermoanaerobaculia bacterium]
FLPATVVALGAVSFFTDLASEMIYPLLPVFLAGTLGAGAVGLGMVEGAAESVSSLLRLASGWWSDRLRRRKPLVVAGYALASAARPLIGFATAASHVLAIRVTDRVGKGLRSPPRDALITDAVRQSVRGRAFGFHRAADHAGALLGPLVAFALLRWGELDLRHLFFWTAVPGALAVLTLVLFVREDRRGTPHRVKRPSSAHALSEGEGSSGAGGGKSRPGASSAASSDRLFPESGPHGGGAAPLRRDLPGRFWGYLGVVFAFTLGNATDAFLLLRASEVGVATDLLPVLWAAHHVVKAAASTPGGSLSDRWGRKPPILAGWVLYAAVYVGFGAASEAWHAWGLFLVYGIYFGLVEGPERALVADLVAPERRGAAFGWYHLAIGVGALPASVAFGWLWHAWGPPVAFGVAAALALVAAAGLALLRME